MRLIDADALKRECEKLPRVLDDEFIHFVKVKDITKTINNAPTIEADDMVKVVQCRDCTHGSQYDDGSDNYVCGYGGTNKGSGFCSDGKRREDENEDGVD